MERRKVYGTESSVPGRYGLPPASLAGSGANSLCNACRGETIIQPLKLKDHIYIVLHVKEDLRPEGILGWINYMEEISGIGHYLRILLSLLMSVQLKQ